MKKPTQTAKQDARKKLLINAMKSTLGNVTASCQEVKCDRKVFYNYYHSDDDFKDEIDSIKEMVLDFAEGKLLELIASLNPAAIMFLLKCKGKERGYIEKQLIEYQESPENKVESLLNKLGE